jgi:hypothetical protein
METTMYGLDPVSSNKVQALFKQQQITKRDADALSPEESKELFDIITRLFNELTGEDKDEFEFKIEPLLQPETKRQVWEQNHLKIVLAIQQNIQKYGTMPTRTQLAEETGISRKSIQHHVKEYEKNTNYADQQQQHKFMGSQLLSIVLKKAMGGDMGAAKLYFSMISPKAETPVTGKRTLVQNQNNYIQVNNTVLNQEKLNQLTPAQLTAIEGIINGQLLQLPLQQPEAVEE